MLPHSYQGQGDLTFVLMHYLGGSHRTWFPTLPYLDRFHRCVALNTPGFGDAAGIEGGYDVSAMADQVDATIRGLDLDQCILVGHSMTGKVAVALASRKPNYLRGLVLVGPSPTREVSVLLSSSVSNALYASPSAAQAAADAATFFPDPLPIQRTLAIVKPNAADHLEAIQADIVANGFTIVARQRTLLSREKAEQFYGEHKGKFFFERLVNFMTSGPCYLLVLAKPGAIAHWRLRCGPTNSLTAKLDAPNSLRALYGHDGE